MTALLALVLFAKAERAMPQVLIVQEKQKYESKEDPNVDLGIYLAEELDKEGRVAPVVWSLTDAFFRAAVNDGFITNPNEAPSLAIAQQAASKMKVEYVIQYAAFKKGLTMSVRATLFRRGKAIWRDPSAETNAELIKLTSIEERLRRQGKLDGQERTSQPDWRELSVTLDDKFDVENAGRSIARTWSLLLATGPWKGLAARPVNPTPDVEEGQKPKPNDEPLPPRIIDNKKMIEDVQRLLANGEAMQAVNLLRDAVDSEPFDVERRRMLISALVSANMARSGAEEARRAAELLPDQVEFRISAARAWIRVGDNDEAVKDLNEAVAREPNSPVTRGLLGEMALMKLELAAALDHLNASLEASDRPETRFLRGLCLTLAGEIDEGKRDFDKAFELGLGKDPAAERSRYEMVANLTDATAIKLGLRVRDAFQRARLKRTEPKLGPDVGDLAKLALGLKGLAPTVATPDRYKKSSERRSLALNLLLQCVTELQEFLRTGDEDVIGDSTLNLGEALKQIGTVREMHLAESSEDGANAASF